MEAKETNIIVVPDEKYRGNSAFQRGINGVLLKLGIQIESSSKMRPHNEMQTITMLIVYVILSCVEV